MRCVLSDPASPVPPQAQDPFAVLERFRHPQPLLVVISGPSGVGKDSVIQAMSARGYRFQFVVTATDREVRPGEVHGTDYYFCTTAEFQRMIDQDQLFEWAMVYDQHKGVPKEHARRALASGLDAVMRLDVQGATTIKRKLPDALSIFIAPPSLDALIERLYRRDTDSEAQLERRMRMALDEMACLDAFDYVVINYEDRLEQAADEVLGIIAAEKRRVAPRRLAF